jgi:hypothetical protein
LETKAINQPTMVKWLMIPAILGSKEKFDSFMAEILVF